MTEETPQEEQHKDVRIFDVKISSGDTEFNFPLDFDTLSKLVSSVANVTTITISDTLIFTKHIVGIEWKEQTSKE